MNDEDAKVAMNIIYYSGNAKSLALESIDSAFEGNSEIAQSKMKEAHDQFMAANTVIELGERLIKSNIQYKS